MPAAELSADRLSNDLSCGADLSARGLQKGKDTFMMRMSDRLVEPAARIGGGAGINGNQARILYAQQILEEMASQAARAGQSGTIGIEIPVKDGRLGKVKRMCITFQSE
jgi:hypothetical protein